MQIVYGDVSPLWDDELYEKIYNQIPKWRKEKADAYKVKKAKCLCVGASFLFVDSLKKMGREDLIDKVSVLDNGKPYFIDETDLYFNMSHSENMVMLALGNSQIGCDIQCCQKGIRGIADRFYTPGEKEYMYGVEGPFPKTDDLGSDANNDSGEILDRFYRIWTRKEAYIKLTGEGLSKPFESFDVFKLDCDFLEEKINDYRICVASWNAIDAVPVRFDFA